MIPTQQLINIGLTGGDETGQSIRSGGDAINDNFTALFAAFGIETISVNIYSNGTGDNILARTVSAINASDPEIEVKKSTLFKVQYSVSGVLYAASFAFGGSFGQYGDGLLQVSESDLSLINTEKTVTSIDANDLGVSTSIQASINNDGVTYDTSVISIFRRTIGGEVKVYAYLGSEAFIGGTGATVTSGDFEDITNNGAGDATVVTVGSDGVEFDGYVAGFPLKDNDQTVDGAIRGIDLINQKFLAAFVNYLFDNVNPAYYQNSAALYAGQANQVADKLYFNNDTSEIVRYLGTTNGGATDYEVQTLNLDFSSSSHLHDDRYLRLIGGVLTGALTTSGTVKIDSDQSAVTGFTRTMNYNAGVWAIRMLTFENTAMPGDSFKLFIHGGASDYNYASLGLGNFNALTMLRLYPDGNHRIGTNLIYHEGNLDPSTFATSAQGALADTALQSIVAGDDILVDSADPKNPIVSLDADTTLPLALTLTNCTGTLSYRLIRDRVILTGKVTATTDGVVSIGVVTAAHRPDKDRQMLINEDDTNIVIGLLKTNGNIEFEIKTGSSYTIDSEFTLNIL